jgi:hypothetical protein
MNLAFSQSTIYERIIHYLSCKDLESLIKSSKNTYKIGMILNNRAKLYDWNYFTAIIRNDIEMIKYLFSKASHREGIISSYERNFIYSQILVYAIRYKNVKIFTFLYPRYVKIYGKYEHNHIFGKYDKHNDILMKQAIVEGCIEIVKFLCENIEIIELENTIVFAKFAGKLKIEKWLKNYLRFINYREIMNLK